MNAKTAVTILITLYSISALLAGCEQKKQKAPETSNRKAGNTMEFKLTSSAFAQGQSIPKQYTGEGADITPPLQWNDAPDGVKSYALICDDPDAPGKTWVHWIIFNIPAQKNDLKEAIKMKEQFSDGTAQGVTDFGKIGYGGPMPPPGKPHRYFFKIYAMDTNLELRPGANKGQLLDAMEGHILAKAELMGTYQR